MSFDTLRRTAIEHSTSRTRVKFFGDFRAELRKILALLETQIPESLQGQFTLDSLLVGNNDIKIRVRDESIGVQKIVSVIFRYHHDDEKYGNVHIEILASELSQKNKSHFLGKYLITNQKKIIPDVCEGIFEGIRAV